MLEDVGELADRSHNSLPAPSQLDVAELGCLADKGGIVVFGGGEIRVALVGNDGVSDLLVDVFATSNDLGVLYTPSDKTFCFSCFGAVEYGLGLVYCPTS